MSQYTKFQEGDLVDYVGPNTELVREGKRLVGIVHARVVNEDDVYVIEFPETKHEDSYTIHTKNLNFHRANKKDENSAVVSKRRKRGDDDAV